MSKEQQLLKYAGQGDNIKVENILKGRTNRLKRWLSRDYLDDVPEEQEAEEPSPLKRHPSLPVIMHKQKSQHVDVNYCDENGVTPLILASLNGHRDVAYALISFSADIHFKDKQGNTALHMAAWQNQSEIVDLLLINGAWPAVTNNEGNTPLHYACQYCSTGKTLSIIKLLQNDSSVLITNYAGDTPLDLAIRYNKQEAVAILVDADPDALKCKRTIIDASVNGRKEVVEILLEAGMDPNSFDEETGKMPLHEGVRYFRKEVAAVLLGFGAQPGIRNGDNESVMDIIAKHPHHRQDDFIKLIKQYHGKKPRIPRAFIEKKQDKCSYDTDPNHITSDPCSYWMIPAPGAYNWVAFDLGSDFTMTGVRIYGWGNKKMIYSFSIETAYALNGPWTSVGKYKTELLGPEDMNLPSEGQDFKGFYATSQYWRIVIADNYGDPVTVVAGIHFYGYEPALVDWFKQQSLARYIKPLVENGFNQFSELAVVTDSQLKTLVHNVNDRHKILTEAKYMRSKYYPPANLRWAIPPQSKVIENKPLPEFSVTSDPYTVGEVVATIHGGGQILGENKVHLVSKDNGYLSRGTFKSISFAPGTYTLEVYSSIDHSVSVTSDEPIVVEPPPKRYSEIDRMFAGFDSMINFDI